MQHGFLDFRRGNGRDGVKANLLDPPREKRDVALGDVAVSKKRL